MLPPINQFDIYKYLVDTKSARTHEQVKNYKNMIGYQMYAAGYIESVALCNDTGVTGIVIIKFQCKPRQRSEDPVHKTPFYAGWVILDRQQSVILNAHCACKGGADGTCRHAVAGVNILVKTPNFSPPPSKCQPNFFPIFRGVFTAFSRVFPVRVGFSVNTYYRIL